MPKTISAAQARARLPQLLDDVEKGKSIVISRYNKPVALISPLPAAEAQKPVRRMGTGKGRVRIIDPHWADPMTDEEVDAMLEGRY
ncbi:MAG: type II toxin-antitoxin system prevent-host-death family antitoxin [Acidobacteriaceae bacterium]